MSKEYNIGIYIRLSMADEDTGYGSKAESDSIGNQRMLINRFLDNHPDLSHCQRSEFADDGYTGTNFHRPQFTQMMEKVKRGEIDLICVKDFSRFSRDYIETGNYLECTFPFMGVRFISICSRSHTYRFHITDISIFRIKYAHDRGYVSFHISHLFFPVFDEPAPSLFLK